MFARVTPPAVGQVSEVGEAVASLDRAVAVGAFGYLFKPFTANDVLRSVLSAVGRRRHDLDAEAELRASREEMGVWVPDPRRIAAAADV